MKTAIESTRQEQRGSHLTVTKASASWKAIESLSSHPKDLGRKQSGFSKVKIESGVVPRDRLQNLATRTTRHYAPWKGNLHVTIDNDNHRLNKSKDPIVFSHILLCTQWNECDRVSNLHLHPSDAERGMSVFAFHHFLQAFPHHAIWLTQGPSNTYVKARRQVIRSTQICEYRFGYRIPFNINGFLPYFPLEIVARIHSRLCVERRVSKGLSYRVGYTE